MPKGTPLPVSAFYVGFCGMQQAIELKAQMFRNLKKIWKKIIPP